MLDQPFQRLPGQIEAVELRVFALDGRHDAQALGVVIKAPMGMGRRIERALARMAEGRMAQVMGERQRLGQILLQAELACHGARDLGHLQAVREPRPVVIALVVDEHLRLVSQAAKGGRVDDAVAVALKGVAGRAVGLCDQPAP